jgi:hypothetical protein
LKENGIATDDYLAVLEKRLEMEKILGSIPEGADEKVVETKRRAAFTTLSWWSAHGDRLVKSDKVSKAAKSLFGNGQAILKFLTDSFGGGGPPPA